VGLAKGLQVFVLKRFHRPDMRGIATLNWRNFILLLISTILVVVACYESPDVVLQKPGVYKGARDPLLAKQRSAQQQEVLRKRVLLIQADR
jgi:hypothetical protein